MRAVEAARFPALSAAWTRPASAAFRRSRNRGRAAECLRVASTPDFLTLKEHRDRGHPVERTARWLLIGLLTAISIAGLLNAFGQHPTTNRAAAPAAELAVSAPARVRGGLLFQGRISVLARETEQMTVNTIEPSPTDEAGQDGRLSLGYGRLEAGDHLVVYLQFQVNPTNVGRRSQRVELRDGPKLLAATDRMVTVFP
jgi:hypothetical protein